MLEYIKDSNGTQIVFGDNMDVEFKALLTQFHAINLNGSYNKLNKVNESVEYHFNGGNPIRGCKEFSHRNGTKYVMVPSLHEFHGTYDANSLTPYLNSFGSDVILHIGNTTVRTPFHSNGTEITDAGGVKYGLNIRTSSAPLLQQFIHWMKTDNGRMINPIVGKFIPLLKLFTTDASQFTGYANMDTYLTGINQPSIFPKPKQGGWSMQQTGNISMRVTGKDGSAIHVGVNGISAVEINNSSKPTPFILVTMKPVVVFKERLPFFVVKLSGVNLFVSVMVMENDSYLKGMKGGVDLLK